MTLTQLEYFCAVCRLHSISRAAEELFVSQPTISMAIRELEKEFHIRLLNHGRNHISITKEGEQFYERAEELLAQSRNMYTDFSETAEDRKPIKIGFPPLMSIFFFPRMTDAFTERSDIPVQLYEYGSMRARTLIDDGFLDLALMNMDFSELDRYNYHILMEEKMVYCVSRNHRFAREKLITMDMLDGEKIILYNTDSVQNRILNSKFEAMGVKTQTVMYSSQLYTILNLVRSGECGAFLFAHLPVNPRDFVELPVEPETRTRFGIIWKKGAFLSHRVETFIRFAKNYEVQN